MRIASTRVDELGSLLFLGIAVAIFVVSGDLPDGTGGEPGPGFFPQLIAVCIGFLAAIQIVRSRMRADEETYAVHWSTIKKVGIPISLLVGYIALLPVTGFLVGTILFLIVFLRYSGVRSVPFTLLYGTGLAVVLQYVFGEFFHIPLPDGIVPFADLLPPLPLVTPIL